MVVSRRQWPGRWTATSLQSMNRRPGPTNQSAGVYRNAIFENIFDTAIQSESIPSESEVCPRYW